MTDFNLACRFRSIRLSICWRWCVAVLLPIVFSACQSARPGASRELPMAKSLGQDHNVGPISTPQDRRSPSNASIQSHSIPPASVVGQRVYRDPAVQPTGGHAVGRCPCCNPGGELPEWARPGATSPSCPPSGNHFPAEAGFPVSDQAIPNTPWSPPGIRQPWPFDEYLFDGGDQNVPVVVDADWTVRGIDAEDTIVHYDTLAGGTRVTPSNRVPIYAPRFRAVRKVSGVFESGTSDALLAFTDPRGPAQRELSLPPGAATQPIQPVGEIGLKTANTFRDRTRGTGIENAQGVAAFHFGFLPYEDFSIIRYGVFDGAEKLRLATATQAAIVWTGEQSPQVVVGGKLAQIQGGISKHQETYQYELPPGKPCVRLVKVASTAEAQPGEFVEFTLRFDNAGDQPVGNVTLIDNLTGRLEYVPDSAQCTLKAGFRTQTNDNESLVLRWEITEPLKVGEGGVIRFKCRVR